MPTRIFISYARADGRDQCERLYRELSAAGFAPWRDERDLDPYSGFDAEIESALEQADYMVVIVTGDLKRKASFVRLEIAYALAHDIPIIPLRFPDGHRPITIINHTFIDFSDWARGVAQLLTRLRGGDVPDTSTLRAQYLQDVGQRYDRWRYLYTDMAGTLLEAEQRVKFRSKFAQQHVEMAHELFKDTAHSPERDDKKVIKVEDFDELREGLREHQRVALIGDPGAGKTTTLERLAYELATEAADDEAAPLPVLVRLGAYEGGNFDDFLAEAFGNLNLKEHPVFYLLDGLNETPPEQVPTIKRWLVDHPEAALVVTCRRLDYIGLELPLRRIDVAPLDVTRIYLFIGNYLEDADRDRLFWALSGVHDSWVWLQAKNTSATFDHFWFDAGKLPGHDWEPERRQLKAVRERLQNEGKLPGMLGVVSNPFLLFIVIQIYARTGEPPANRGQLFDQFVTLLLEYRGKPAAKTKPPWIAESIQREALAALAYRIQADQMGTSVDAAWARQVITAALPRDDADHLLYLAASASLIEHGKTVRFVHQLLQEYFAAGEMKEDITRGVPATKYFPQEEWWLQTGWEETVLLLAGMEGDATQIVQWLTPVQPTLAYRCATESGATCEADALQALYDPELPPMPNYPDVDAWRQTLPRITPLARAEWGRRLAEQGDTRYGVGVGEEGLPTFDWVEIPGGEFIFGDDDKDAYPRYALPADEQKLTLSTFYIARYPVTYAQFQTFIDDPEGIADPRWWEGLAQKSKKPFEQAFKYANHPRDNVNWYQAMAFCRWFSWRVGGVYDLARVSEWVVRLPTEQEWEKAARGTDGRVFPWGHTYIAGHANVDETEHGDGPYWLRTSTAVEMYPQGASPYGVLDMSGNVWEWCLTDYDNPQERATDENIRSNTSRVLRGGSWDNLQGGARAAFRGSSDPSSRDSDGGFRVCASSFSL